MSSSFESSDFTASTAHLVGGGNPLMFTDHTLSDPIPAGAGDRSRTLDTDAQEPQVPSEDVVGNSINDQVETASVGEPSAEPKKKKIGLKLAIGGAAVAAALIAAPHAIEAKDAIVDHLAWAAPALITSEAFWDGGAILMLIAAGKKVGNPLKLHSRFKEVSSDFVNVVEKPLFKTGMVANILGELGTASILIGGSIAELPPSTWPLTMGTAVALAAPATVAWTALWRSKHPKTERQS